MTDKQKIKHAIAVLGTLEVRYQIAAGLNPQVASLIKNTHDLKLLLEEKHVTQSKEVGCATSTYRDALQLAQRLCNLIHDRKPNMRSFDLAAWASEMDKIIRIDRRTGSHLAELIDWTQQDRFWQNNILSPSKLRKQLDRLELQMSADRNWQRSKLRRKTKDGPTAKQKYMENLNANSSGADE